MPHDLPPENADPFSDSALRGRLERLHREVAELEALRPRIAADCWRHQQRALESRSELVELQSKLQDQRARWRSLLSSLLPGRELPTP
jgi:hypothetical protein